MGQDQTRVTDDAKFPLPPDIAAKVRGILDVAQKNIRKEQLAPVAFIINRKKDTMDIFAMSMANEREKNMSANLAKLLCEDKQADCVVFLSEAWTKEVKGTPEEVKAYRKKWGTADKMPGHLDIVQIHVEIPGRYWFGRALITKFAGNRRFGPVDFYSTTNGGGRFVGWLKENRMDLASRVDIFND
jgi:hypothetical protein